jgi:phosphoglycerate dehydrogenase-like enzyme
VHAISAGIDFYVSATDFRASPIPLTNGKGVSSAVLGEFNGLGMLYHTKKLESFA